MKDKPDILNKILATKLEEISQRQSATPVSELQTRIEEASPVRGFVQAMLQKRQQGDFAVIAEIKKASPSKGIIREQFYPVQIAQSYQSGGAACLSVLTDSQYFQGHEDFLVAARGACILPVLRKDFMISEYQIYESRVLGADCILLIVAALDEKQLIDLYQLASETGMDVLVEVHDEIEMERALKLGPPMIGINNRNLRTFETSLFTTINMLHMVPDNCLVVTESGINTRDNVDFMSDHQVNAFLVGEAFMRQSDPGLALEALFFSEQTLTTF